MPINEARREPTRERWPLQFDLMGIPRDTETRKRALEELQSGLNLDVLENSDMDVPKVKNTFAGESDSLVDGLTPAQKEKLLKALLADAEKSGQGAREFDLSKPPVEPYSFKEYPKAMYSADGKQIVNARDERHQKHLEKEGFLPKPPQPKSEDEAAA